MHQYPQLQHFGSFKMVTSLSPMFIKAAQQAVVLKQSSSTQQMPSSSSLNEDRENYNNITNRIIKKYIDICIENNKQR